MIDSCVLKFYEWIYHRKEATHMAYSKPKTIAKSAKKSSFVAGCPTHSPHEWSGHGTCTTCEVAK